MSSILQRVITEDETNVGILELGRKYFRVDLKEEEIVVEKFTVISEPMLDDRGDWGVLVETEMGKKFFRLVYIGAFLNITVDGGEWTAVFEDDEWNYDFFIHEMSHCDNLNDKRASYVALVLN